MKDYDRVIDLELILQLDCLIWDDIEKFEFYAILAIFADTFFDQFSRILPKNEKIMKKCFKLINCYLLAKFDDYNIETGYFTCHNSHGAKTLNETDNGAIFLMIRIKRQPL